MEEELMMLNILFPGLIEQTSECSLRYKTDQIVVDFEYPEDYPDSHFTYKTTPDVAPGVREVLDAYTGSTTEFISQLS